MTDPRLIDRAVEAVVQSIVTMSRSPDEAADARGELSNALRALVDGVSRAAADNAARAAGDLIDRETVRRIIAPELERYWARQRKDRGS